MSFFGKYMPEVVDNFQEKRQTSTWWRNFKKRRVGRVKEILAYYKDNDQYKDELAYLKRYGADYFPYDWSRKKSIWNVHCKGKFHHPTKERYIVHNGKKLYAALTTYSQLLLEQHPNSPHAYFSPNFYVEPGDCFVDIGAAEGMISLDVVDRVEKCILIECSEKWKHGLMKTFEPYREKVKIVSKYVSDINDDKNITLDELLKDVKNPVLSRKGTKVAICTYHRPEDEKRFSEYFQKLGYWTEKSEGYMAMLNGEEPPYFRKAMLRAKKVE